jgi:diguanylate cyclase (GGDEF)-like protein
MARMDKSARQQRIYAEQGMIIERLKHLSIRYKLTFIILFISGVILLLASTVFVINDVTTLRDMMTYRLQVQARIIGYNSIAAMDFNDPDAAGQTLAGLRADPHILAARLYTADGDKFASYQRRNPAEQAAYEALKIDILELITLRELKNDDLKNVVLKLNDAQLLNYLSEDLRTETLRVLQNLDGAVPVALQKRLQSFLNSYDRHLPSSLSVESIEFSPTNLRHAHLIKDEGKRIGMVMIVSDLVELRQRLFSYFLVVIMVIIASVALAFFLSARLQRIIALPILTLAGLAKQVSAEKNYSLRGKHDSHDELGTLFQGFNAMLAVIQERDEQLAQHRDELEKTVELRTAELRKLNTQLTYQAYHDALTNLPNRAMFVRQVEQSLIYAKSHDKIMAMLFLDLDHFKYINDTLGHSAGDRLLQEVSKRILNSTRQPEDLVARLGGDEFTVMLRSLKEPQHAAVVAEKIIRALKQPFRYDGQELHITTSIGISLYPLDGEDVGTLMRNADSGMYQAKQRGRNTYEFYTDAAGAMSKNRLHMENRLRDALEGQQFEVWFQPRFHLENGALEGAEALVRWRSPELNLVAPAEFIPLAEDTGLIIPIGEWVLRGACEECLGWQQYSDVPLTVSVNFSARQFAQEDLLDKTAGIIREMNMRPELLELELTESLIMPNADETIDILRKLKNLGLRISIDDFGTGYSSLSYLKRFPIDILKIDRSFIFDVEKESFEDSTLVTAIIAMAHKLKLKVVAEGVETEGQLALLRQYQCDYVQGYLFGRPMPAHKFRYALENNYTLVDFRRQSLEDA